MMSKRPIITVPDPLLRQVSTPVETVDGDVRQLMDDLLETMYDAPGIGLAAVQVGVLRRVVVLDVGTKDEDTGEDRPAPIVMANPEIVALEGAPDLYEEGCLSIPDTLVDVERPSICTVRYVDRDGEQRELTADGLLAKAIQHEVDHLDGRLIIDHLSSLKREIVIRKLRKSQRATV